MPLGRRLGTSKSMELEEGGSQPISAGLMNRRLEHYG